MQKLVHASPHWFMWVGRGNQAALLYLLRSGVGKIGGVDESEFQSWHLSREQSPC